MTMSNSEILPSEYGGWGASCKHNSISYTVFHTANVQCLVGYIVNKLHASLTPDSVKKLVCLASYSICS